MNKKITNFCQMGLVLCCLLISINWLTAQDIIQPINAVGNFTVVAGAPAVNYYDDGGADCDDTGEEYSANNESTAIICPDVAGQPITIEFLDVDIETRGGPACWDFLNIYDGNSTAATQVFSGCGEEGFAACTGFPGDGGDGDGIEGGPNDINGSNFATPANNIFTSTDASGCLTVEFDSDGSVQEGGWTALVSAPAVASTCVGAFGPFCYDMTSTVVPVAVDICPDPGQAIQIDFTAGGVENNFDELQVFCGAMGSGTGGTQIYNSYGAAGDLAGLSFSCPVADRCISVYINSDGSVTCNSSGFTPIEFTSSCVPPLFDDLVGACYDSNEASNTLLEICPAPGFNGVDIEFLAGEFEINFDELTIYSGPAGSGTTGTLLAGQLDGDLTGLTFSSVNPGDCIILISDSDGSVSCASGSQDPISIGVTNTTIVAPACTFTITCPPALTLMAGDPIPAAPTTDAAFIAAGGLINSAGCAGFTVTSMDSPIMGDLCTGSNIIRTFTITETADPANSLTCTQMIDTDPQGGPVVVAPADVSANCIADVTINPDDAVVTSTDPAVTVTATITSFVGMPECPGSSAIVTYTAVDACGNVSSDTQTIFNSTPAGTGGPVITAFPPSDTVDCFINLVPNFNLVEATTNCGGPISVTATPPVLISGTADCNNARYSSTYTVTDDCGRSVTRDRICVLQNDGPEFVCPVDICVIECPADTDMIQAQFDAYAALAKVNTSCVGQTVSITNNFNPNGFINQNCNSGPLAVPNTQRYQIVTFRATACNGTTTCTAIVAVVDNTPPTIQGTPTIGVAECSDDIQAHYDSFVQSQLDLLNATDECSVANGNNNNDLVYSSSPATPNLVCDNGAALTSVELTVTDRCGNAASVTTTFLVRNTTGPTVASLPNKTVECGSPLNFDTPVVTDACGNTTVTFVDNPGPAPTCPAISSTTRTFTVTDACGGSTTAQQTISVVDTQAPVAPAAPADVTVSCADNLPPPVDLTASDNCTGTITVSPAANITAGACDNQFVMVRTWTFTDGCNTSSVSQTITVNDDIAPVFTFVPNNMTGQCMGTPMAFEDATATDNCSGTVTITFVDDTNNSGPCGTTITRTWTATDACGNAATASATMSTGDAEAPVASNVPANTTIDCNDTPTFGTPTFTDNCATDVTVVITNATVDGDCDGEFVFTRTWTATDDCDNTTVVSQTITSQDTDGPVFVSVPTGTVVCDGGNFDDPVVSDNCSSFTVTFVDDTNGTGCDQMITRTYTATDDCGNATMATATFSIIDNEAPVFTNVPPTLDVDCDEVPEFTPPTAVDNCGDVALTFVETESGELCDQGFSRKRVWTATDNCGNTATVETSIWVNKDNTPPVFTFVPPTNIMINCEDFPPTFGNVEVEDDCSGVTITFEDDYLYGDENSCDNGESFDYRRRWTATDGCGNESTAEQKFWVMPSAVSATISGALMTEEHEMTDNVMLTLENSNAVNFSQLSTDGNFMFPVILNQNYTLTPERDDDLLNGISTYDLILMGRHLLETELLDSPYKLIAADINNSGSVTTLDMIALRRLILHIDNSIDNNTSWRFVESEYVFADPTNPFASTFPEVSNFNGITQSQIADFMAIKIGDLNGSAAPNQLAAGDTRSADGDLVFQLDDVALTAGEQYEVAFKARDFAAVEGYQYTLNFAGLEIVDVQAGALRGLTANNFGMMNLDRGILTTSWNAQTAQTVADDEVLFTLVVEATEAIQLSKALRVSSDLTPAEGYSETSDKLAVSLRFGEDDIIGSETFALYQNRPNPFGSETTISFNLPEAMDATLTIYDVSGRVLKQVTRNYAAGYNEELVERNELGATGILYYQLETATETATKKMILVK